MSDRTTCLTVVLDNDFRIDDIDSILNAIRMIKGVAEVKANVSNPEEFTAYIRAKMSLEKKLWEALKDE
ncbi:MAG: hypothetical protein PHF86_04355 [Candidatus Nanoarchaeia archaeon]|jgi:hypothetical protein|nr:hypothetical protein [Candidatus Nanoarchaeia archaeon]